MVVSWDLIVVPGVPSLGLPFLGLPFLMAIIALPRFASPHLSSVGYHGPPPVVVGEEGMSGSRDASLEGLVGLRGLLPDVLLGHVPNAEHTFEITGGQPPGLATVRLTDTVEELPL